MSEPYFSGRRKFVKQIGLGSVAMGLLPSFTYLDKSLNEEDSTRLVILHTNDMHSHIDPFPADDPKYAGLGGMAKRFSMIEAVRKEHKHILLLDAGDVFQG